MNSPSNAVSMKLALVLMTLTRTVLLASVRARVKRPHMMALKRRFIAKKNWERVSHQNSFTIRFSISGRCGEGQVEYVHLEREVRIPRSHSSSRRSGIALLPKML